MKLKLNFVWSKMLFYLSKYWHDNIDLIIT